MILSVSLILLVLIQQGKGADMGAAFGAGSSNSLFGAAGAANLLTRLTTGIAIAFMFTSIILVNYFVAHRNGANSTGSLPQTSAPLGAPVQNPESPKAETAAVEKSAAEAQNPAANSVAKVDGSASAKAKVENPVENVEAKTSNDAAPQPVKPKK